MTDLLLWIGALLMVLGFLGYAIGFPVYFSPFALFMFGGAWNAVIMMLERSGMMGGS